LPTPVLAVSDLFGPTFGCPCSLVPPFFLPKPFPPPFSCFLSGLGLFLTVKTSPPLRRFPPRIGSKVGVSPFPVNMRSFPHFCSLWTCTPAIGTHIGRGFFFFVGSYECSASIPCFFPTGFFRRSKISTPRDDAY